MWTLGRRYWLRFQFVESPAKQLLTLPVILTLVLVLLTVGQLFAAEPRYGVAIVRAAALWPFTKGSGIKVGIIDTGIDLGHPALQAAYRGGYDFVHNDSIPEEETAEGHGTFVAGVVLQVAPETETYALKIFGKEDFFDTADLVRAIDWAIANHLKLPRSRATPWRRSTQPRSPEHERATSPAS